MDDETGLWHFEEFRTKRSPGLADFVKLDAMEARRKRKRLRTGVGDGETGRGDARNSAVEAGVSDLRLYFFGILK